VLGQLSARHITNLILCRHEVDVITAAQNAFLVAEERREPAHRSIDDDQWLWAAGKGPVRNYVCKPFIQPVLYGVRARFRLISYG